MTDPTRVTIETIHLDSHLIFDFVRRVVFSHGVNAMQYLGADVKKHPSPQANKHETEAETCRSLRVQGSVWEVCHQAVKCGKTQTDKPDLLGIVYNNAYRIT